MACKAVACSPPSENESGVTLMMPIKIGRSRVNSKRPHNHFSDMQCQTWLFTIFSSLAAAALLWFGPRTKSKSWALIGGLLLGGVVGNLIDRVTREPGFPNGHVIDFLQLPFGFPIFNLADTAIVVAMSDRKSVV